MSLDDLVDAEQSAASSIAARIGEGVGKFSRYIETKKDDNDFATRLLNGIDGIEKFFYNLNVSAANFFEKHTPLTKDSYAEWVLRLTPLAAVYGYRESHHWTYLVGAAMSQGPLLFPYLRPTEADSDKPNIYKGLAKFLNKKFHWNISVHNFQRYGTFIT